MKNFKNVPEYIAKAAQPAKGMMKQLRAAIKATAPKAKERISYAIPFYEYKSPGYKGRLVYYATFRNQLSVFIVPRNVPAALAKQLKPYKSGRSALHFPLDKKLPIGLIKKIIKLRMKEIDESL